MEPTTLVSESLSARKKAYEILELCKNSIDDKDIINVSIIEVDLHIEAISLSFSQIAKTGPEKLSLFYTLNHLLSVKESLNSLLNISGGSLGPYVKWFDMKEIFDKAIKIGMIKNFGHLNLKEFLNDCREKFISKIKQFNDSCKVYTVLNGDFELVKSDQVIREIKVFNTQTFTIFQSSDLVKLFDENVIDVLRKDVEEFEERESGWTLKSINFLNVHIHKYNPLRAGTYIQLPPAYRYKNACINVKSDDNMCFKWAIISALTHRHIEERIKLGENIKKIHNTDRVSSYLPYVDVFDLDFNNINFPTSLHDIQKFEKKNNISINVYTLENENNKNKVSILQPSTIGKQRDRHINLLLLQAEKERTTVFPNINDLCNTSLSKRRRTEILENSYILHYLWIQNLDRFISSQLAKTKRAKFLCDLCFHYFPKKEILQEHEEKCQLMNDCKITLPENDDRFIKFKNFKNKEQVPWVIYADFESILEKIDEDINKCQIHIPVSIGYFLKCRYDNFNPFVFQL